MVLSVGVSVFGNTNTVNTEVHGDIFYLWDDLLNQNCIEYTSKTYFNWSEHRPMWAYMSLPINKHLNVH